MIVLDTNVISEVFKPQPDLNVVAWLETFNGDIAITTITLAEILAGVRRLPDGHRKSMLVAGIDRAIQPYRDTNAILAFDESAAEHYASIVASRERSGAPITMADAQIAAICRSRQAVCATRNTKDFAGTGVVLINPWSL